MNEDNVQDSVLISVINTSGSSSKADLSFDWLPRHRRP